MVKKIIVVLFFLLIAIVYIHNLTRDIYGGDIGDLVTAAFVGGVAHPPGYPLFSLLGFILSHLPIPLPVVSRVGLISVFSSLVGLILYYKFAMRVTKSIFLSLLSTSIFAFSYLFWLSAELPESLGLNNLFAIAILYLSILFYERKKIKYLYLAAFLSGLSMTHQMSIGLLFPALLILYVKHLKFILSHKRLVISILFFLLGFAVYIYVPIAASRNPPINWDSATSLKNFIHLILRKDYGGGSAYLTNSVPLEIRFINVLDYIKTIVLVFSYQILFVAFLGVVKLIKIDKRLALSILLAFIFTGALSIFYVAAPFSRPTAWGIYERYYTLSTVILMFSVPYGFLLIKNFLDSKFSKPFYTYVLISYFLIIPFFLIQYNFPKTDLSKTTIGNSLANNIFSLLPKNSVLFVSGDNTTFNIWYAYYVLKERQDLDIINPPGVGNNIYLDKELNEYYKKNPKTDMKNVIQETFDVIKKKRRVFATYEIKPIPPAAVLLPKGLVFELISKEDIPNKGTYLSEVENLLRRIKVKQREKLALSEQNFIAPEVPFIYSMGIVRIGDYLINYYKDYQKSEHYYRRALWIDDSNSEAYAGLALSLFHVYKDCDQSLQNIKQAISIYPIWRNYYIQEYYFAKNCKRSDKVLDNLRRQFKVRFNQDIDKQIK